MEVRDPFDRRLRGAGSTAMESSSSDGMLERVLANVCGSPTPAQKIGRFVVERSLGRGGMGTVLEAWDDVLERKVAIKLLRRDAGSHARRRGIIEAEARALARLADRHVVAVHETGEHDGALFVVMELVDGPSLDRWQRENRTPAALLDKYVQAARGLAAAHRAGLVHRDFKPANVLIRGDGEVRVADFGLARAIAQPSTEDESPTENSASGGAGSNGSSFGVSGTRAYMAPEQIAFGTTDTRTDQFSFCVALHEALAERRPFDEDELVELALGSPPRAGAVSDALPSWLGKILARGLARDPGARWPSMDDLVDALVNTPLRRKRLRAGALGVGVVAIGGASLAWSASAHEPSCDPSTELEPTWNPSVAAALESGQTEGSFEADSMARVRVELDAYAERWKTAYRGGCQATWVQGTQTPRQFERSVGCLHRARAAFGHGASLLRDADAETLARASDIVAGLPAPRACLAAEESEELSERELALLEHADRGRLLLAAGRPKEVVAAGNAVGLGEADQSRAAAEAWLVRGSALAELARHDDAEGALLEAVGLAAAHDARRIGVDALTELLGLYSRALADVERADVIAAILRNWVAGIELDPSAGARVLEARGRAAAQRGKLEDAEILLRRGLEDLQSEPDGSGLVSRMEVALGGVLHSAGRADESRAMFEDARRDAIAAYGHRHPQTAAAEHGLGVLALDLLDLPTAQQHLDRALSIRTDALGKDSLRRAGTLAALAQLALDTGDSDRAIELATESRDLQASLPLGHPDRGSGLEMLARAHLEQGHYDASLAEHRALLGEHAARAPNMREGLNLNIGWLLCELDRCVEARPMFELVLARTPDNPVWAQYAAKGLAEVELSEGRPHAAIERAARTLSLAHAEPADAQDSELIADLKFTIASALTVLGTEPVRAVELARDAERRFVELGRPTSKLDKIRQLLAEAEAD